MGSLEHLVLDKIYHKLDDIETRLVESTIEP